MTDIEQGLKEAVQAAAAGRSMAQLDVGDRYGRGNGKDRAPLTAPNVIDHIAVLTKSAAVLEGLAFDLSNELAGQQDYAGAKETISPNHEAMTVFDRMGYSLLELTRTIESIEREVKRSLGAVKP
jgi:hypothetical protein